MRENSLLVDKLRFVDVFKEKMIQFLIKTNEKVNFEFRTIFAERGERKIHY